MGLRKFLTSLGLSVVSADPDGGQNGEIYYNDTSHTIRAFINGSWVSLGVSSSGLPAGGTTGQVLTKIDSTNYNAQWSDSTALAVSTVKHEVKLGEAVTKGQAVYVSSADGTNMIVSKASNASEATSSKTMGLVDAAGSTNDIVNVVTEGLLAGLDTSTAGAEGDPVWLGTGGNLIYGLTNKPSAPAHLVFIGIVTRKQQNNGEIFVKVQNGFELSELHTVSLEANGSLTDNEVLAYDTASSLWKNQTHAEANIADASSPNLTGTITLDSTVITNVTISTVTTTSATTIYTLSNSYSAAEFLIQASQASDKKTLAKVLMVNDGTEISMTLYGITEIGTSKIPLSISGIMSGTNLLLQATVSDANINNATIRVVATAVVA